MIRMNSDLFFDGKQYISSSRAAKISGYANDYIGQLCRDAKINSRMVGRTWYVEIDSLICHKNNNINGTRSRGIKKLSKHHFESRGSSHLPNTGASSINISYPAFATPERSGVIVPSSTILVSPKPISSITLSPKKNGKLARLAVGVCGLFIAVMGFQFGLISSPKSQEIYGKVWNNINQEMEASVLSATKVIAEDAYRFVRNSFKDWFFESKETILVLTGNSKVAIDKTANTDSSSGSVYPSRGMVVVPTNENTDRDGVVNKIKQSFSDEVVVTEVDEESGVITPVFKDSRGDDYLFVLVPIGG